MSFYEASAFGKLTVVKYVHAHYKCIQEYEICNAMNWASCRGHTETTLYLNTLSRGQYLEQALYYSVVSGRVRLVAILDNLLCSKYGIDTIKRY